MEKLGEALGDLDPSDGEDDAEENAEVREKVDVPPPDL